MTQPQDHRVRLGLVIASTRETGSDRPLDGGSRGQVEKAGVFVLDVIDLALTEVPPKPDVPLLGDVMEHRRPCDPQPRVGARVDTAVESHPDRILKLRNPEPLLSGGEQTSSTSRSACSGKGHDRSGTSTSAHRHVTMCQLVQATAHAVRGRLLR
jgi:hypothetical protein